MPAAVRRWMQQPLLLNLLLLLSAGRPSYAARPLPKLARPDYSYYHTKDGVFDAVKQIMQQCPDVLELDELSSSEGNYSAKLLVVNAEPGGTTADHSGKLRLLLNFGEHGRELISSEIALRLLQLLCDPGGASLAPLLQRLGLDPAAVQALLKRVVFKIVPMENVGGRALVEKGQLCERKNGRGVDTNRNWDVHWGHKEADYDPSEENPGTRPFSEPEAALLRGVVETWHPHLWLNVHSGMEALFMPYDHKGHIPEGASANATLELLHALNAQACGGRCAVGSGGKTVGYLAHGTATDWMYVKGGVPLSMTWEVYGDSASAYEDCFRMFNPTTKKEFEATVERWAAAVLQLLALLPTHPDLGPVLALAGQQGGQQGGGEGLQGTQAQQQPGQQAVAGGSVQEAKGAGGAAEHHEQHVQQDHGLQVDAAAQEALAAADAEAAAEAGAGGGAAGGGAAAAVGGRSEGQQAGQAVQQAGQAGQQAGQGQVKDLPLLPASTNEQKGQQHLPALDGRQAQAQAKLALTQHTAAAAAGATDTDGGITVTSSSSSSSDEAEEDARQFEHKNLLRGTEGAAVAAGGGGGASSSSKLPAQAAAALLEQQQQQQAEDHGGLSGTASGGLAGVLAHPTALQQQGTAHGWKWVLWMAVGLSSAGAASYAWRRPRSRYMLSRWVGSGMGGGRQRHRRHHDIPI